MRVLLLLVCGVVAGAVAKPSLYHDYVPAVYSAYYPYTSSQYHAQDELGQYSYGYTGDTSAKHETKTLDGVTRGGYSYVDANGVVQTVNYVADDVFGFRVAATNLPQDSGSVVAAAAPYVAPQQVAAAAAPYVVPQLAAAAPYVVPQVAAAAPYVVPQQVVAAAPYVAPQPVTAATAPYVVSSQPVFEDSPAVTAAKVVHHANVEAATVHAAAAQAAAVGAPLPVADTPEVQRAKAEHIAAVQRAAAEAAANPDTGLVTVAAAAAPLAPVVAAPAYYGAPLGGVAYAYGTGYPLAARTYSYIPAAATSYSALTPLSSQYHAQDELGQYSYGYSGDTSTKHETKTLDGVTRGSYSYVDANGVVQTVNYVADDVFGFRVAATNLPLGPGAHWTSPETVPSSRVS